MAESDDIDQEGVKGQQEQVQQNQEENPEEKQVKKDEREQEQETEKEAEKEQEGEKQADLPTQDQLKSSEGQDKEGETSQQEGAQEEKSEDDVKLEEQSAGDPKPECSADAGEQVLEKPAEKKDETMKTDVEQERSNEQPSPGLPGAEEQGKGAESVLTRTVRLWKAHIKERKDCGDEAPTTDRLAASKEFRGWVQRAELELQEGGSAPSFTEVWLAINTLPKSVVIRRVAPAQVSEADAKRQPDKRSDRRAPNGYDTEKTLLALLDALKSLQGDPKTQDFFNGSRLLSKIKQLHPDFSIKETPFGQLAEMLLVAQGDGWVQLSRHRDLLKIRRLPSSGVAHLVKDWDAKVHKKDQEREEVPQGDPPGKQGEDGDPLADFAAQTSSVYKKDDEALALVEPSEQLALVGPSEHSTADGRDAAPEQRNGTRSLPEQRPLSPSSKLGRAEIRRMFDEALKSLCDTGLQNELPMNASVISGHLRRTIPGFSISKTPFLRFGDLLDAMQKEGLIKVGRNRHDVSITWVKYPYRVTGQPHARARSRQGSRNKRRPCARSRPRQEASRRQRGRSAETRGAQQRGRGGARSRSRHGRGGARSRSRRGRCAVRSRSPRRDRGRAEPSSRRPPNGRTGGPSRGQASGQAARPSRGQASGQAAKRGREPSAPKSEYEYYSDSEESEYTYEDEGSGSESSSCSKSPPVAPQKLDCS
ncbi:unnamed protein product [Polarella glacialis]|uniref:Uncharacterized protein n=1 Tax=Polarella glacialis TaxID=89957 RepID=A0A813HNP5_POLGL|nr:unnamed protein product [Polarella glacialis]